VFGLSCHDAVVESVGQCLASAVMMLSAGFWTEGVVTAKAETDTASLTDLQQRMDHY